MALALTDISIERIQISIRSPLANERSDLLVFSVASYNLLANAYVQYALYKRSPRMVLEPAWRVPALVQQVTNLGTDLLCLQEVDMATFAALKSRLAPLGYGVQYARKLANQPDGCATFYRQHPFELIAARVVEYADGAQGQTNSGHIALLIWLRVAGRIVGIANTHLSWDPPDTTSAAKLGYRQALQLLNASQTMAPTCDGWLICGDLNAMPDSEIVAALQNAGFQYAHAELAQTYTCKVNSELKMIDYLFHSANFRAQPERVLQISDETILPSAEQPSDHLPIVARFFWTA
jgi:mRNA deadenylase 3'-5' endonuclease subunit Ccr4